jgi:hypothetical protein
MSISYTISATGKNYYKNNQLIPAWEQAKNFVQDKLFSKVSGLLTSAIGLTADTACAASSSLSSVGSSSNGALSNLDSLYGIYNETLSCTTSETDGTFSVTYNGLIKRNNTSPTNHPASRHTFSKTINTQDTNKKITTINIQGTIEGLVSGGVVTAIGSGFQLPNNGSILTSSNTVTKYSNALTALNKLIDQSDLKSTVKSKLGITIASLGLTQSLAQCSGLGDSAIIPSSFSLTHNYHEGIINYNIEYSSDIICGQVGSFSNITLSVENPTPILAELPIPHTGVLLIQDMETQTAKRVSITIEGGGNRQCCLVSSGLSSIISGATFTIPSGVSLPNMSNYILTQKQRTDNIIDGSYTINLSYICSVGCS